MHRNGYNIALFDVGSDLLTTKICLLAKYWTEWTLLIYISLRNGMSQQFYLACAGLLELAKESCWHRTYDSA